MASAHKQHRFLDWLPSSTASLVLQVREDPELERLRQVVMRRRDMAIFASSLEIGVSVLSMALYDIRRSILVPIVNTVLTMLACVGLRGALVLELSKIQVHGVITTGLIIACLLNFLAEALLTHAGLGTDALPAWLVLLLLFVPYSLNLACSSTSLMLGSSLAEFLEREDEKNGLLSSSRIEQQAEQLSGQDRCCVCMDSKKDAVITPCGHRVVCTACGDALKARVRCCPVCRGHIGGVIRVFDS